jgi:hypothetical protein
MPPKLTGHALQLAGHGLVFLGLGVAAAAMFASGNHPAVPTWAFVAAGVGLGAPLMIAGGRIDSRGRGLVLGQSRELAAREYRQSTVLLALYLGFLWLLGSLCAVPVFFIAAGWVQPDGVFVKLWLAAWVLIFCAGRDWTSRPLWRAIERRARARWGPP